MILNLNEYKKMKTNDLKYFFRGVNFKNINKEGSVVIDDVTPECSEFFNGNNPSCRITEEFLKRIKENYNNLIFTDLEFSSSKEEVDYAILQFVSNIRRELDEYKLTLIKQEFVPKEKIEKDYISIGEHQKYSVREDNLLYMGLNFIKLRIGENIYSMPKTGHEAEKEDKVADDLNLIMIYIYLLISAIKDKKQKISEFVDVVSENIDVKDPKYLEMMRMQFSLLNIKDYEEFILKYEEMIEKIKNPKLQDMSRVVPKRR